MEGRPPSLLFVSPQQHTATGNATTADRLGQIFATTAEDVASLCHSVSLAADGRRYEPRFEVVRATPSMVPQDPDAICAWVRGRHGVKGTRPQAGRLTPLTVL